MKRVRKGQAGYVKYERVKRLLITLLMFALPLGLYFIGIVVTGSNKNILTVVSVVGILPAARAMVSWIMTMLSKEAPEEIIACTEKNAGSLVHGFELMVTAYEGRMPLDAVVVCGNNVACYATYGKSEQDEFMQTHIEKILATNGYRGVKAKIFRSRKQYEERIVSLTEHAESLREGIKCTPDPKYPDLNRDEMVLHTIMAIAI